MTGPSRFESAVTDPGQAVATDLSAESDVLLVALGGIAGGFGIPPFEFSRMLESLGVKKLFIRDLRQAWYHGRLPGLGRGIDGIAGYLRHTIGQERIRRSVLLGNSMGGYAALVLGALVDVDEVHSFSPITFIGPVARLRHRDWRWRREIWRAQRSRDARWAYFDARRVLAANPSHTSFHIHYSTAGRLDELHATRMAALPNVTLHAYEEGGHMLVKHMRDAGVLATVLSDAVSGGSGDAARTGGGAGTAAGGAERS
jgi:hypothetical protein